MTEPDAVLDMLRRARPDDLPDELASPQSPAAQALLEEILSMQTTQNSPDAMKDPPRVISLTQRGRRRYFVGAAAAAAAALVAGLVLTLGSSESTAAVPFETAVARTSDLMGRSGRAEVTHHSETPDAVSPSDDWSLTYEFSGKDVAVIDENGRIDRFVDGKAYTYGPVPEDDPNAPFQWQHIPGNYDPDTYGEDTGPFDTDPRTLMETLGSAGTFEEVGNDEVDGFPTRRMQATAPNEALDAGEFRAGVEGTASRFEVWVDDDGLVRRIEFRIEDAFGREGDVWEVTIRLFDLGEPIVIEAPANAVEWDPPPDAGHE